MILITAAFTMLQLPLLLLLPMTMTMINSIVFTLPLRKRDRQAIPAAAALACTH